MNFFAVHQAIDGERTKNLRPAERLVLVVLAAFESMRFEEWLAEDYSIQTELSSHIKSSSFRKVGDVRWLAKLASNRQNMTLEAVAFLTRASIRQTRTVLNDLVKRGLLEQHGEHFSLARDFIQPYGDPPPPGGWSSYGKIYDDPNFFVTKGAEAAREAKKCKRKPAPVAVDELGGEKEDNFLENLNL